MSSMLGGKGWGAVVVVVVLVVVNVVAVVGSVSIFKTRFFFFEAGVSISEEKLLIEVLDEWEDLLEG